MRGEAGIEVHFRTSRLSLLATTTGRGSGRKGVAKEGRRHNCTDLLGERGVGDRGRLISE